MRRSRGDTGEYFARERMSAFTISSPNPDSQLTPTFCSFVQHIKVHAISPLSGERNPASGFGGNALNALANHRTLPHLCVQLRGEIIEAACRCGVRDQPHYHYLAQDQL
jgi:hypothetical protein